MGSFYDDTGSSSLPALMDSYISFDQQTHTAHLDEYEQVPCFSNFSQTQTNITSTTIMDPNLLLPDNATNTYGGGTAPYNLGSSCVNPNFAGDQKALKAVLSELAKMERDQHIPITTTIKGSPSFGEGSSESYLSEVGMPNLWNNL